MAATENNSTDLWQFYRFCPECAGPLTVTQSDDGPRLVCSNRHVFYQNPHTAAAAVIIRDHKVLMIRRRQNPFKDLWDFPGGFVNWGEDPKTAIIREAREELGITFIPDKVFGAYHDWYPYAGLITSVNAVYYIGTMTGELRPNPEVTDPTWFPLTALPTDLSFDSVKAVAQELSLSKKYG